MVKNIHSLYSLYGKVYVVKYVLLVEDNQDMRKAVAEFLESDSGFKVVQVPSTEEGIDAVDENEFDIALVDINLPGKSGFSMIEYIRDEGKEFPVIALTARDGLDDKLKGFNLGVNDYVVKPFDLPELKARMLAHMKSDRSNSEDADIKTSKFSISPSKLQFKKEGKEIELTQLEFRMIYKLMQNNQVLVKLDDLIEYAWGEDLDIINPPIRIHIANIRKKIGDETYQIIRTIPGTGYIFNDEETQ